MADDFGIMIINEYGNAFITPQSYPLTLYRSVSVQSISDTSSSGQIATASIETPNSWGISLPFAGSTTPAAGAVALSVTKSGSTISFVGYNASNSAFTLNCFLFSQFEQSIPYSGYGAAFWDESGRLILTSESRILTDITTIGTQGGSDSGLGINTSMPGRYAVSPAVCGTILYQQSSGAVIASPNSFTAQFDGSNTTLKSAAMRSISGVSQVGSQSYGNVMNIINIENYM